ncbi:MAG: biotin--[acetyl-CoA-carboxylase] ligase [Caldilineaceae bacterium]
MTNNSTPLDIPTLRQTLRDCPIGHTVHYWERTASTMPLAHAEMAAARAKASRPHSGLANVSGALFVTEEQTAGRGRLARTWETPYAAALLMSIPLDETDLTPPLRQRPQLLPMLMGIAVAHTLAALPLAATGEEPLGPRVALKWPNDILLAVDPLAAPLVFGKVAGILIESTFDRASLDYVVIGIGLNVNQTAAQLPPPQEGAPPPVSLCSTLGRRVDRTSLLVNLCRNIAMLLPTAPSSIYAEWRGLLHTLGQPVTVHTADNGSKRAAERFEGTAIDVTPDGDLVVENAQHERRHFSAGVVTLRPN